MGAFRAPYLAKFLTFCALSCLSSHVFSACSLLNDLLPFSAYSMHHYTHLPVTLISHWSWSIHHPHHLALPISLSLCGWFTAALSCLKFPAKYLRLTLTVAAPDEHFHPRQQPLNDLLSPGAAEPRWNLISCLSSCHSSWPPPRFTSVRLRRYEDVVVLYLYNFSEERAS